jgi:hypothetical protein
MSGGDCMVRLLARMAFRAVVVKQTAQPAGVMSRWKEKNEQNRAFHCRKGE